MNSRQFFQSDRTVEILTTPNKIHGTGYRIGGRLILTCTHVFKQDSTCKVKSESIGVKSAKVIWKAPDEIDITLLELSEEVEPCSPISFGKLPESDEIEKLEFDFLGWPAWGFVNSDNKDKATGLHIEGDIYLKDISAHDLLSLEVHRSPSELEIKKENDEGKTPWQGASGSSIIVNGLVVGVLRWHQNPDRPQSLEAESLERVYNNQEWCEILTKHGIAPEPIPVQSNWLSEEEKREAITDLLQKIKSFHNKLKLFHSSEEIILQDQYIPIQVTLERRYKNKLENIGSYAEAEAELRKIYALKGSSEEEIKEEIKKTQEDWNKAKENQNYIIVLADPGMGKSTLLRIEVCQTVEKSLQELKEGKGLKSITIPLFIRLSSLADEENLSIDDAILKLTKEAYSRLLKHQENETVSNFLNEFIKQQLQAGKVLLLLDALDEVSLEKRNKLIEKLNTFVKNISFSIIATSRIVGYGGKLIDKGKEMEIVPFTQKQTEDYINTWFNLAKEHLKDKSITAQELIKALQERPQLSGLAQNPLLLSLICSLYQEDKLKLPARRGQVYEQAVDYMLTKWCIDNNRMASNEAEIETKKEILMELAYQFSKKGTEVFSLRELKNKIKDYLRRDNATDLDNKSNQFITELSEKDGILQKLNQDKSDYLFLHRTFQEYFTALYLKYQIEDDEETGINLVKQYLWDYDWHETLIILAGLLDEPMVLIEAIRGEKDDIFKTQLMLAGRCLGECDKINDKELETIFDRIYKLWEKYPRLEFIKSSLVTLCCLHPKLLEKLNMQNQENIEILGEINHPEAIKKLNFLRSNSELDDHIRETATWSLFKLERPKDFEGLRKIAQGEIVNKKEKYKVIEPLPSLQDLELSLKHGDFNQKYKTLLMLRAYNSPEARLILIQELIASIDRFDFDIKCQIIFALEEIADVTILETLIQCPYLNIHDPDIFKLARRLAIKYSKSGSSFIPVYAELIIQNEH